jgi:heme/copper-type cytochrome/quinol oxidase subunit 2
MSGGYWSFVATLGAVVAVLVTTAAAQPFDELSAVPSPVEGQDQGQVREFTVSGNHYRFSPASIPVNKNDLVKITFTSQDMAHSFTIDDYRIVKRAGAGQTVTFEFRADRAGSFTFYCNLSTDEKCKEMKGTLTVR